LNTYLVIDKITNLVILRCVITKERTMFFRKISFFILFLMLFINFSYASDTKDQETDSSPCSQNMGNISADNDCVALRFLPPKDALSLQTESLRTGVFRTYFELRDLDREFDYFYMGEIRYRGEIPLYAGEIKYRKSTRKIYSVKMDFNIYSVEDYYFVNPKNNQKETFHGKPPDFFKANTSPSVNFFSNKIYRDSASSGRYSAQGYLTINGISKEYTLDFCFYSPPQNDNGTESYGSDAEKVYSLIGGFEAKPEDFGLKVDPSGKYNLLGIETAIIIVENIAKNN
jgi:polyisoprenoid-binding protein YceI